MRLVLAATVWLAMAGGWAVFACAAGWLAWRVAPAELAEWRAALGAAIAIAAATVCAVATVIAIATLGVMLRLRK
jgi:hypothetical protein